MHVQHIRPAEIQQVMPSPMRTSEKGNTCKTGATDTFWRVLLPASMPLGTQIASPKSTKELQGSEVPSKDDATAVQTKEEPVAEQVKVVVLSGKTQDTPVGRTTMKCEQIDIKSTEGAKHDKVQATDDGPQVTGASNGMQVAMPESLSITPVVAPPIKAEVEPERSLPEEKLKVPRGEAKLSSLRQPMNGTKGRPVAGELEAGAGKASVKTEAPLSVGKASEENTLNESKIAPAPSNLVGHGDARHEQAASTSVTALDSGGKDRVETASSSTEKIHTIPSESDRHLPTMPETLAAGPRSLEVGVLDATLGWLKIRAELDTNGGVNASLTSGTLAHERLRDTVPEISGFLAAEAVHVEQISVHHGAGEPSFRALSGQLTGNGEGSKRQGDEWQGRATEQTAGTETRRIKDFFIGQLTGSSTARNYGSLYKGSWLNVTA